MLQTTRFPMLLSDRRGAAIGEQHGGGIKGAAVSLADHRGLHPRKVDGGQ